MGVKPKSVIAAVLVAGATAIWLWADRAEIETDYLQVAVSPAENNDRDHKMAAAESEGPQNALQNDLARLTSPERERLNIPSDAEPVARLEVDLTGVHWWPNEFGQERDLPRNYDELRDLITDGDPDAALVLGDLLAQCFEMGPPPMSDEEFAEELRLIEEDHRIPQYHAGVRTVLDVSEYQHGKDFAIMNAKTMHERCKGLPLDRRSEASEWRAYAIENGSPMAQERTAIERAMLGDISLLESAWNDGDPTVLNQIANFHYRRFQSGEDPAGRVKSLAYLLAWRELNLASREAAGPDMRSWFGGYETTAFVAQRALLPAQVAEARDMAVNLLRNRSTKCCMSLDVPLEAQ